METQPDMTTLEKQLICYNSTEKAESLLVIKSSDSKHEILLKIYFLIHRIDKYDAALLLDDAINTHPDVEEEVLFQLCAILLIEDNFDPEKVKEEYENLIASHEEKELKWALIEYYDYLSQVYAIFDNELLVQALQIDSIFIPALLRQSYQIDYFKDPNDVLKLFQPITELNEVCIPKEVHNQIGLALLAKQKWSQAKNHFDEGNNIIKNEYSLIGLGIISTYNSMDFSESEHLFLQAIELNPFSYLAYKHLMDLYFINEKDENIIDVVSSLMLESKESLEMGLKLFVFLNRTKKYELLNEIYENIFILDSSLDISILKRIALCHKQDKDPNPIMEDVEQDANKDYYYFLIDQIWSVF